MKIRFGKNAHAPVLCKIPPLCGLTKSVISYCPTKVTVRPRRVKTVVPMDSVDTISVVWVADVISSDSTVGVAKVVETAPVREFSEVAHPTGEYAE